METPKAFISFDYETNSNEKAQFLDVLKNANIQLVIDGCSSKPTLPDNQWNNVVSDKINYCNMLVVLVGKTTANIKGVANEIKAAREQGVPVFGVFIHGASSATALPQGLDSTRIVKPEGADIAAQIKKVMKEGKNELLVDKASGAQGDGAGVGF